SDVCSSDLREWTGEAQWKEACSESTEALWKRRDADGYWMQDLYGVAARRLAPVHGLVGNVRVLLDCVDEDRRATLMTDTARLVAENAVIEHGLANWPIRVGEDLLVDDGEIRVQWCAG